jgi:hypothetical protein
MTVQFDIFRVEAGGVLWLESSPSLVSAKARIQELSASLPGDFLVLDHETGKQIQVRGDGSDEMSAG